MLGAADALDLLATYRSRVEKAQARSHRIWIFVREGPKGAVGRMEPPIPDAARASGRRLAPGAQSER